MSEGAAIDTDVLLKASAYRLAAELVATLAAAGKPAALGLTHLIAGRQLARRRGLKDPAGAQAELQALLAMLSKLEPDEGEVDLAADLAAMAQELGVPLDAGEAQLVAITVRRNLPLLVTGDKRAVGAVAAILPDGDQRAPLVGRIACFEQILESVLETVGAMELRSRICAEPDVDGAMRLACSCGRHDWDPAQLTEACGSFIRAVRAVAGDLLRERSLLA
jgi:hypothetical protein